MNRDFVGRMNERNGAYPRLPASCPLSSYIVLLFQDCRGREREKEKETERGREKRAKPTAKWEDEDGRERSRRKKPARRSGFGPGCSGVALPCGDHKGSRRILILVSPNLLTYLTYPEELTEDSSGTLRQLNPKSSILSPTRQPPILICLSLFSFSFYLSLYGLSCLSCRFFPFLVVPR